MEKIELKSPDGSITRLPGKEPLLKPTKKKMKKSLSESCEFLNKKLDNESAFYQMVEENGDEEVEQPNVKQQSDTQQSDDAINSRSPDQIPPTDESATGSVSDEDSKDASSFEDQEDKQLSDEEISGDLRQEGYSDAEIAHILHGYIPQGISEDQMVAQEHHQDLAHKNASHQQDLQREKAIADLEIDHEKRMSDLEYEYAKKEKDLKIKYMEQEFQTKIANIKSKAQDK